MSIADAACATGPDPGRMARIPGTSGMKNEAIMVRSQRNFYGHAIRAAGLRIVEVGLPDRYAGAGVHDAEVWEIEDAITGRTAAILYVANGNARPPLAGVTAAAHRHGVPVIVDAVAQLPPQSNLRRLTAEGAASRSRHLLGHVGAPTVVHRQEAAEGSATAWHRAKLQGRQGVDRRVAHGPPALSGRGRRGAPCQMALRLRDDRCGAASARC